MFEKENNKIDEKLRKMEISNTCSKIWTFRKFRFLTKIWIFDENFDFWRTFQFLTKISTFDENFEKVGQFWIKNKYRANYQIIKLTKKTSEIWKFPILASKDQPLIFIFPKFAKISFISYSLNMAKKIPFVKFAILFFCFF